MNDRILVDEWSAQRHGSLRLLPIAVVLSIAFGVVIYTEGLHRSENGFLFGVLFGALIYWAVLEAMTVVRVNRLFHAAATTLKSGVIVHFDGDGRATGAEREENL